MRCGQRHAAAADADQGKIPRAAAFLHDLMGEALQRAVDFRRRHELAFLDDSHIGVNANTSLEAKVGQVQMLKQQSVERCRYGRARLRCGNEEKSMITMEKSKVRA